MKQSGMLTWADMDFPSGFVDEKSAFLQTNCADLLIRIFPQDLKTKKIHSCSQWGKSMVCLQHKYAADLK